MFAEVDERDDVLTGAFAEEEDELEDTPEGVEEEASGEDEE